jgi:hypothetical protein
VILFPLKCIVVIPSDKLILQLRSFPPHFFVAWLLLEFTFAAF